jgi:hypothetical protein
MCSNYGSYFLIWTQKWRWQMGAEAEPCRLGLVLLLACLFIQPLCSLYTAAYSHAYGNDNTYGMTAALLIS